MTATIHSNEIKVEYSIRPMVNREFLTVSCPDGWDDVKKICKKILTYQGKKFAFTGWNSDRNEAFFAKPINGVIDYATVK
jgi:diphthamide synthase subunit DPH2